MHYGVGPQPVIDGGLNEEAIRLIDQAHSYFIDPMLNDTTYNSAGRPASAFTLQPGSPARGAGANVCSGISGCSMGTQDFFGNPLPAVSGFDIGAHQADSPTVKLLDPANNAVFSSGKAILVVAEATGHGAGIEQVEFFQNGTSLGMGEPI